MPNIPEMPKIPGGGTRQQRAEQLKAEMEGAKQQVEQTAKQKQSEDASTGPVGQGDYIVREGDCVSSIAKDTGHFWETLWNHADNAELKEVRKDPNLLLPGDRVTVPEIVTKQEPGETEARHRFKRRGEPAELRLQILERGEPRANQPFEVDIDGTVHKGTTDPNGNVIAPMPGNAKKAILKVGPEDDQVVYELNLGSVHPISEPGGILQRLTNMGFYDGPVDTKLGPDTEQAIRDFQEKFGLEVTGSVDEQTRKKLEEEHGS